MTLQTSGNLCLTCTRQCGMKKSAFCAQYEPTMRLAPQTALVLATQLATLTKNLNEVCGNACGMSDAVVQAMSNENEIRYVRGEFVRVERNIRDIQTTLSKLTSKLLVP